MSLRNLIPASLALALLAGCAGTTTSTADEQSVGYDASKPACCHKDGKESCEGMTKEDKAACEAACKKAQEEKAAANATIKG